MAKRKRLTPATLAYLPDEAAAAETPPMRRAPIADVASDAATVAALEALSGEINDARDNGRLVQRLPLAEIELSYLMRDRLDCNEEDMAALTASIRDRGQQSPVDVVALAPGRYGLISGWRRCEAIKRLQADGQGDGTVLALLRRPDSAAEAYQSMIEENEIRIGLSYFERARVAYKAVELGVFTSVKEALLSLYATASRAKRSKIRSFITLVEKLEPGLRFPQAIGERLGLQLAKQLETDPGFAADLCARLTAAAPESAEAEQSLLGAALAAAKNGSKAGLETKSGGSSASFSERELRPGLTVRVHETGRVELSGPALTPELRGQLLTWLQRQPG